MSCGAFSSFSPRLRAVLDTRLARDSLTVFSLSGLGRVVALGKEMLVAALFGVSGQLDAYVLALLAPSFLANLLGSSFSSALIPALGRIQAHDGEQTAQDAIASSLAVLAILLTLAALLLVGLPAQALRVLSPLAETGRLEQIQALQLALLPVCVLGSLNNVLAALVNLRGDFKRPALASIGNSMLMVAATALFSRNAGIYALVIGMDAGFLLEACVLLVVMRRTWGNVFRGWRGQGRAVRGMLRNYGSMALSTGLMGLTIFVDNALASMTGEGAVSALSYAVRIPSVVTTLVGATLATVLLPHFSSTAHAMPQQEFWGRFKRLLLGLLLVVGLLALASALLSRPLVELVFQRGGFDVRATGLVSGIQVYYLLQLPFYLANVAATRVLQAKGLHHLLLGTAAVALPLNAGLSYVLIGRFGAAGIAMSSLCMYLFISLCSVYFVRRACHA
jgi:putative peptidoglycan lipid II flippase